MLPVLQIGSLAVQVPGLVLLAGLWIGLWLAERTAHRHGISSNNLYNLVLISLVVTIIAARISYVAQYPAVFAANPANLFSLNPGLLDLWGGLAAGLIAALIFGSRKRLSFWSTLDALTPTFATIGIALALANLASGNAYGVPTNLPWGVELWGERRHPTQLYDFILSTMIAILILIYVRQNLNLFPGRLFLTYLAFSSTSRLLWEGFRSDSYLIANHLRGEQVIAWFLLAVSLIGLGLLKEKTKNLNPS